MFYSWVGDGGLSVTRIWWLHRDNNQNSERFRPYEYQTSWKFRSPLYLNFNYYNPLSSLEKALSYCFYLFLSTVMMETPPENLTTTRELSFHHLTLNGSHFSSCLKNCFLRFLNWKQKTNIKLRWKKRWITKNCNTVIIWIPDLSEHQTAGMSRIQMVKSCDLLGCPNCNPRWTTFLIPKALWWAKKNHQKYLKVLRFWTIFSLSEHFYS